MNIEDVRATLAAGGHISDEILDEMVRVSLDAVPFDTFGLIPVVDASAPRRFRFSQSDIERYWSFVDCNGPTPCPRLGVCWAWIGCKDGTGYPMMFLDGASRRAHIVSYELARGPTAGMCVCHRCDNRECTRPDHLFLGTKGDNNRDRARKGRSGNVRLGAAAARDVLARIAAGETQAAVAARYGVTHSAIQRVINGQSWAHATKDLRNV